MLKTILAETKAIQDCYKALESLEPDGQERVVNYLASLLDLGPPSAPPAEDDDDGDDEE